MNKPDRYLESVGYPSPMGTDIKFYPIDFVGMNKS